MAKVTGPLLALDATGTIGKTITFTHWKSIKVVKSYAKPANPRSPLQLAQRAKWREVVSLWHTLSPWYRQEQWDLRASCHSLVMSGFNLFIQRYIPWAPDNMLILPSFHFFFTPFPGPTHYGLIIYDFPSGLNITLNLYDYTRGFIEAKNFITDGSVPYTSPLYPVVPEFNAYYYMFEASFTYGTKGGETGRHMIAQP